MSNKIKSKMNNVQKLNKLAEKKAGQIFDKVKKQGGEIICDITFPIYCIEFDEMITGHIHRLFIKDNTLFVESEDYEQTIDPISDYTPYGIFKIHEKILAKK